MSTEGRRIYAIGDVHGCRAELAERHRQIDADLAARPHPAPLLIHLGDYTDRGPDSRGVIEDLMGFAHPGLEMVAIRGNHDVMTVGFLDEPHRMHCPRHYLTPNVGGPSTLASYGVPEGLSVDETHALALDALPADHVAWLRERPLTHRVGDYLFVHAGIRPGVPLAAQEEQDLIWIRREFLDSTADHGMVVVHGHTPVDHVERRPNRIGIDTGCVFGGHLSCLVLEDEGVALLDEDGLHPLPLATTP